MPTAPRPPRRKTGSPTTAGHPTGDVDQAVAWLKRRATKATLAGMARYAIPLEQVFGVAMRDIQALAKQLGRDHACAAGLWASGWYEARLLAAYVEDPHLLTIKQMDRWCRDFDNWAVCDTVCFALFDRTPHAWGRVTAWARSKPEFSKRAAFALLWGLSVHDKTASDHQFIDGLGLVESAATDERLYVKKAVNMALRAIGKRNQALHAAALTTAKRLAESSDTTACWIGKDARRELASPSVARRLARTP